MKTCATPEKIDLDSIHGNLFLPVPDTDFRAFLEESLGIIRSSPSIVDAIEADLNSYGLEKKVQRVADFLYVEKLTEPLGFPEEKEFRTDGSGLRLEEGRPRMPAELVFLFILIRGFLGSLTDKEAQRFLLESMSFHVFLANHGWRMPGRTTILENVNKVTLATRQKMLDRQIEYILAEELDDFRELTLDSTSVHANSCWPTDSRIILGLLGRIYRAGQKFDRFGLDNLLSGWVPRWLKEMESLEFKINQVAGKPKSKGKVKKHYRRLLNRTDKAISYLSKEIFKAVDNIEWRDFLPSRRQMLLRMVENMLLDLKQAAYVADYAADRVLRGISLPSSEKVLSISDPSAAFIIKGGREAVIGYKPQLVRTSNGFVSNLVVPPGNASDSGEFVGVIEESIKRSGITPNTVSVDDGYASKEGKESIEKLGVKVVSISGSKGKKLTDPEDWDSAPYKMARNNRSAVESLMFTIKDGFAFGELGRRGLDEVRCELLEKALAYNLCRITLLKSRKPDRWEQAA